MPGIHRAQTAVYPPAVQACCLLLPAPFPRFFPDEALDSPDGQFRMFGQEQSRHGRKHGSRVGSASGADVTAFRTCRHDVDPGSKNIDGPCQLDSAQSFPSGANAPTPTSAFPNMSAGKWTSTPGNRRPCRTAWMP